MVRAERLPAQESLRSHEYPIGLAPDLSYPGSMGRGTR
jgi:hypothetical protein